MVAVVVGLGLGLVGQVGGGSGFAQGQVDFGQAEQGHEPGVGGAGGCGGGQGVAVAGAGFLRAVLAGVDDGQGVMGAGLDAAVFQVLAEADRAAGGGCGFCRTTRHLVEQRQFDECCGFAGAVSYVAVQGQAVGHMVHR